MTLILNGTDNSATTPAVTGTDTDTGVFFPAANVVAFATAGTEDARFDASGNLLLGTTTTVNKLTVFGNSSQAVSVTSPTGGGTQVGLNLNPSMTAAEAAANPAQASIYATDSSYSAAIIFANKASGAVGNALTERMRINAGAPILCLAGGSTTATGTGIAFPATQSASTNANTLDDYEEGTWTPTFTNNTGTITYTAQLGNYVKVGKIVQCEVYIRCSGVAGTGTVILSLPIVTSNFGDPGAFSYNDAGHTVGVTSTADNPRMRVDASALTLEGVKSLGNTTYLSYNELCSGGTLEFAVLFSYISLD
jgi:hypothetical protein